MKYNTVLYFNRQIKKLKPKSIFFSLSIEEVIDNECKQTYLDELSIKKRY